MADLPHVPPIVEANFDGLVGPTHNYAGLSHGNLASGLNEGEPSRPREAALQGLAKMRALVGLGLVQGVLPPQERPHLPTLRRLGYAGSDAQILERAAREAPVLLRLASSASSMWAANAATVCPRADSGDGRTHFVPANLRANFHRTLEPEQTARALARAFPDEERFVHHAPLPSGGRFGDEGAANHTRLGPLGRPGAHLFVHGGSAFGEEPRVARRFAARQSLEASEAVARLFGLDPARALFVRQDPDVIDDGVFHNDVICVGHGRVLFHHERAFADRSRSVEGLRRALDGDLVTVEVTDAEASVEEVVASYLFNSQLLTLPGGRLALVAPVECREREATRRIVERITDGEGPIDEVHYLDVRQSMRNGGGPACLRLRVQLEADELAAVHPEALVDGPALDALEAWVARHYREELRASDLGDPQLLVESRTALDELTRLLDLGTDFYPFQRGG